MKLTSTNITLTTNEEVRMKNIYVNINHLEELRDLCNDALEIDDMHQCPDCGCHCTTYDDDGSELYRCHNCGCKSVVK